MDKRLLPIVLALAALAVSAASASAASQRFTSSTPITIPEAGPATPYSSDIKVTAMPGPVTNVAVTLHRFGHTNPADVDVLLVSPSGSTVNVMAGNCGVDDVEDVTWTLDQHAAEPMPQGARCPELASSPNGRPRSWPAPAPAGPHGFKLDAFNGENANGTWSLYVKDSGDGDKGDVEGGWTLSLTTGAYDLEVPATGTSGPATPYPVTRTVSGVSGVITDVDVVMGPVSHQRPDDLDILLVGPGGEKVVLMSDACGTFDMARFKWVFSDDALFTIPDGDGTHVCGGAVSAFDLTDPNGEWRLYVNDDSDGEVGFFADSFELGIATRPKAAVAFTEHAVEVAEGTTRALTLKRSGPAALGAGSVTVTTVPAGARPGSDFTAISRVIEFAPGEIEKTVPAVVLANAEPERDEAFAVTLGSPIGDAALAAPSTVVVTIPAPRAT